MEKNVLESSGTPSTRARTGRKAAPEHKAADIAPKTLEITFPQGLIGCPDWQHFQLTPVPFVSSGELICTDQEGIGLIVADPASIAIDNRQLHYHLELDEDDVEALQLRTADDARILCVLTIRRDPASVTANLAGPLVINMAARVGKQVVLDHHEYPLRAPIFEGEIAQMLVDALTGSTDEPPASTGAPQKTPASIAGEGASSC